MALYARVENGVAVEKREMAEPPPAHKIGLWRLVVDPGAPSCEIGEIASRSESEVNGQWVVAYSVGPRPDADIRAGIKAEAQRRIVALTGATDLNSCFVKQLNALMRGTELTNKKASGGTLTAGEEAEAAALQGLAAQIKAIRAKSDALEVTLPVDYTADAHWQE